MPVDSHPPHVLRWACQSIDSHVKEQRAKGDPFGREALELQVAWDIVKGRLRAHATIIGVADRAFTLLAQVAVEQGETLEARSVLSCRTSLAELKAEVEAAVGAEG